MTDQPYLPRFSDPADIDEFVGKLESFERGELGSDAFRAFRLTRGVYGQRQPEVQMLRVKIPAGIVGRAQLDAIADVADDYSRGFGHVTTRQNVQLHFISMSDAEAAMRRLDEAGLTTREACGNSVRTISACEVASVCQGAPFDVTPHAEALTRYFLRHPLAATLPRKFKTAFSGCASDCAKAAIHDLGFIAAVREGVEGFRVVAAGGLSTLPMDALTLHEFVPSAEISRVGEAVLRLFDRLGNRENRHRARLKYVRKRLGDEAFLAKYEEVRREVDAEAIAELRLPDAPSRPAAGPIFLDGKPREGYLKWRASSVVDQRQDGYAAVYIRLTLGDITSTQMRALGALLDRFGDGSARLTIDQNILVPFIDGRSLPALHAALDEIGLASLGLRTARDVTSCPGAESCNLAVTASRRLAESIEARLASPELDSHPGLAQTTIKISGCPNSCGQHHIADLGFHGAARKEASLGGAVPMYQLHLGGGVDDRGARFGRQVVKIVARRVPDAVVRLLDFYVEAREPAETVAQFYARIDPKRVVAALAALLGPPTRDDLADIGESEGFIVHTGEGECAA